MATIYPSPDNYYPEYDSERKLFNAVQKLNSSWTAFFNSKKGTGKQESDCILVHKTYGVFSLEAKGGTRFLIEDGQWKRVDGDSTRITNPLDQAENNRGDVMRILKKIGKVPDSFSVIVLPDLENIEAKNNKYGFSENIIISKSDFDNLGEKLKSIRDYVLKENKRLPKNVVMDKSTIVYLKDQLLPSLYLPDIKTYINTKDEKIVDLGSKQIERWRDCLDQRNPTIIEGQNGTGKTILARALAKQRDSKGLKTLLICKQLLLNRENKKELENTNVDSFSYYELLFFLIESLPKKQLEDDHIFNHVYIKMKDKNFNIHADFQSDIYNHIADSSEKLFRIFAKTYDALIVDEGQQFSDEHIDSMRILLKDDCKDTITVFADKDQAEDLNWKPPIWLNNYPPLLQNYRNTNSIVKQQEALLDKQLEESRFFGPSPTFKFLKNENDFYPSLIKSWNEIVNLGFSEKQIVILSTSRTLIESMKTKSLEEGTIPSDIFFTIEEFTGLEKFAVILLWSNIMTKKFSQLDKYRRGYQGTGRAQTILKIISTSKPNEFYQNESLLQD